jgi:hypothetical protein
LHPCKTIVFIVTSAKNDSTMRIQSTSAAQLQLYFVVSSLVTDL